MHLAFMIHVLIQGEVRDPLAYQAVLFLINCNTSLTNFLTMMRPANVKVTRGIVTLMLA